MLVLTFDTDWAPEPVLADCLELLNRYNAKATFFITAESPVLNAADVEIGLHPNFNNILKGGGGDFRHAFDELLDCAPSARGFRSHSLVQGGPIYEYAKELGLEYDGNTVLMSQLAPYRDYIGLLRIPAMWSDGWAVNVGEPPLSKNLSIDWSIPAVFMFHPIHVYLNTDTKERFKAAHPNINDPAALAPFRNVGGSRGIRDFLEELLTFAASEDQNTLTMADIVDMQSGAQ